MSAPRRRERRRPPRGSSGPDEPDPLKAAPRSREALDIAGGRRRALLLGGAAAAALASIGGRAAAQERLPIFDAHVHYSHDAAAQVPVEQAVQILRQAGLRGAFVSSSDDEGTQRLLAAAPDLIVPELRPYRTRADTSGWVRDAGIVTYLEQRLAKHRYAGIGEFHLYGADVELPVPKAMVALARERDLLLHAHSDADAVERLFKAWPQARILWAHSGFDRPDKVRELLRRHGKLWCDLAFRSDMAAGASKVEPSWRDAFVEFPDRFMVGTDTFTPERWHYIVPHADFSRGWLADLPRPLAENIGWRNAETVLRGAWTTKKA